MPPVCRCVYLSLGVQLPGSTVNGNGRAAGSAFELQWARYAINAIIRKVLAILLVIIPDLMSTL